jgi:nitronate monooxygenase
MKGMNALHNRFTQTFDLETPIALAPMALASGGALTSACVQAGALGLVGGGYGELAWTEREYRHALELIEPKIRSRLGIGFITWKLDGNPSALEWVLKLPPEDRPRAVMLSFGDPRPYGPLVKQSGGKLICQIQNLGQIDQALEAGADVIVAQGGEAGGHGAKASEGRSTFTLTPQAADYLAQHSPETLLLAAGGIADGRGLSAAICLGADGALVGSRLWASKESLASRRAIESAIAASGDETARSSIFDILRRKDWPEPYDFRALRNDLHRKWESRIDTLRADPQDAREEYDTGVTSEDFSRAHTTVGEAVGLIKSAPTAAEIISVITTEALSLFSRMK